MHHKSRFKLSRRSAVASLVIIAVLSLVCAVVILPAGLSDDSKLDKKQINQSETDSKQQLSLVNKMPDSIMEQKFHTDYSLPPIVNGLAPVVSRLTTKQNIVFLGIDDGAYKDQSVVDLIKQYDIKASLFLSRAFISGNPDFFKQIVNLGSVIEDHTLNHDTQMVKTEGYAQMKNEICGMADYDYQHYGVRPTLFRPPGGAYNDTMRRAAADCGMKALIIWIAKANGGSMQYQIGNKLRPGDIVLMHFRPVFKQDMEAFVAAMTAAGLHTELLEDAL